MDATKLSDKVQEMITDMGKAFFFAYYLPALLFVALHQYALLPAFGASAALLPGVPGVSFLSGELLTTLLLPFVVALLLVTLNTDVIRFFEGAFSWQRKFLLRPWQKTNEKKSTSLYKDLRDLKKDYRRLLVKAEPLMNDAEPLPATAPSAEEEKPALLWLLNRFLGWLVRDPDEQEAQEGIEESPKDVFNQLTQTAAKMQAIHEQTEASHPTQTLPIRADRVRPTTLGNVSAVFEEYPLDRYGMDSVLLWPRLRQVADEKILKAIDNKKMFLDFDLNVALFALLFMIEAIVAGFVAGGIGWWVAGLVSLLLFRLSYIAAIYVNRSMGTLVDACFDFYRGKLLEQYGLPQPSGFFDEYKTWLRLTAFLRRGELPYWPGDLFKMD